MRPVPRASASVSLVAKLPEFTAGRGVQKGTMWATEMFGKGWGAAEGSMDPKTGRTIDVLRVL